MTMTQALEKATHLLAEAQHLVVFTGAGISKASGIPTFREAQTGLWAQFNPEDLATEEGFLKNPKMVWEWYDFRRNKIWGGTDNSGIKPNAGHFAIATLQQRCLAVASKFTLITQNIDNLHTSAGSQNVLELHGNIFRYKCLKQNHPLPLESFARQSESPPLCPQCKTQRMADSYVRPDVVWFGEMLPPNVLTAAFEAAEQCDVMLVVGTSGLVQPAASLPLIAKQQGAHVIEINPEPSMLTPEMDIFLQGPAGVLLPQLLAAMPNSKEALT